jgi:glycerol uptake facilitator-like aquaporin
MNPSLRACIAELAGTFTLTFVGAGAIIANSPEGGGNGGLVAIALAHGLAFAAAIYATGGGHINPAVTLAMVATRRIRIPLAAAYIAFQLAGAVIAAFLLKQLYPQMRWRPRSWAPRWARRPARPSWARRARRYSKQC